MVKVFNKIVCWDCKKKLKKGDEVMPYHTKDGDFFKCKSCHKKDKTLRNFKPTEVYSRITGYIRPLKQFNPGKQAEFHDRKTYDISNL
jgi:anaerobic ribonucleoside-triphosphate reductase